MIQFISGEEKEEEEEMDLRSNFFLLKLFFKTILKRLFKTVLPHCQHFNNEGSQVQIFFCAGISHFELSSIDQITFKLILFTLKYEKCT
jgi:hypothetical protein